MDNRVQIKNMVNSTVILTSPDLHFRREWNKKGQINSVPMDILRDLIYDEGVNSLFTSGALEITDKKVRIELGLEQEGVEPERHSLTENQMLGALFGTPKDIENAINTIPPAQIDDFVDLAVDREVTDMAKVDVFKRLTGKDILNMVKLNRQIKEEEKKEALEAQK